VKVFKIDSTKVALSSSMKVVSKYAFMAMRSASKLIVPLHGAGVGYDLQDVDTVEVTVSV